VLTLAEYASHWLEGVAALRVRPASVEQYALRLRLRVLPAIGHLPLTSITRETVRTLIGDMVRGGSRRSTGQPVSRATVRETVRTLNNVLATAEEDGLIPANPARKMGKYLSATDATEASEVEIFDRAEVGRLLELAESDFPEYHPFVLCLARTGMRLGEAIALEWRDVDWITRVLLVRRSRRRGRVSEPKNGKLRRVDMSAQLADVLRGLKTLQEAEAVLAGREPPERVFSAPDGGPVSEDVFRKRVWTPLLRRAGLRYRKPHSLRHTFASLLLAAGGPDQILYVQKQLGHHSPEFTLRVYGHLLPRGDHRAVDVLDDATGRNPLTSLSVNVHNQGQARVTPGRRRRASARTPPTRRGPSSASWCCRPCRRGPRCRARSGRRGRAARGDPS
jgi:integrase